MYIPLLNHSAYSLGQGLPLPAELVQAAAADGAPALGLTDHRLLTGAIEFVQACLKAGIQPVLGLELETEAGPLALFATSLKGWSSLCSLSSALTLSPEALSGGVSPEANSGGACPEALSGGARPEALSGGARPEALSGGVSPEALSGGARPEATSGGARPEATSGGARPEANSGGARPEATSGGARPEATSGGARPEATSGGARLEALGGGARPEANSGGARPEANSGGARPEALGGGARPASLDLLAAHSRDLLAISYQPPATSFPPLKEIFAGRLYLGLDDPTLALPLAELGRRLNLPLVVTHSVYYISPQQASLQRTLAAMGLNLPLDRLPPDAAAPAGAWFVPARELERRFQGSRQALAASAEIAARCKFDLPLGVAHMPTVPLPAGLSAAQTLRQKAEAGAGRLYGPLTPALRARLDHELEVIARMGFEPIFLIVEEILAFARRTNIPFSSRGSAASSLVAHCLGITSPDPLRLDLYFERFLNPARTTPPDIDTDLCSRRRDLIIQHVFDTYGPERVAMVGTINRFRPRSALGEVAKAHGLPPAQVRELVAELPYAFWARPEATSGGARPEANSGGARPEANSGGVRPEANSGGARPEAISGGARPEAVSGGARPEANSGGARPEANSGGARPEATSGGARPEAVSGGARPEAISGGARPEALSGGARPEALSGGATSRLSPFAELRARHPGPAYQQIFNEAEALLELPRHLSVHAGGVVVAPGALTELVPVMRSGSKGVTITQFDLGAVEALGLVKIDLLGIRGLTVLGDVAEFIQATDMARYSGSLAVLESIPSTDPETSARLESGGTIGCFQIESPGMRATLRQIRARSEDDLMAALALYRPGPLSGGLKDAFVRRFKGEEPVEHIHPALEALLSDTYGVILYQEQVLRIANKIAGFSLAEADLLRRAMSHFDPGRLMQELQRKFVAQAQAQSGVPLETGERIWEMMAAFAGYGFPKAHAASYASVAWRSAWCKTHFPAEFMAAVLANWGGYYSQNVYLGEARRLGLAIHPPHVNHSGRNFVVAGADPSAGRAQKALYMGLDQVRDLTARTIDAIRHNRPFASLEDFLARVDPRPQEAEALARMGAFEGWGAIPTLLRRLETGGWQAGQPSLFDLAAFGNVYNEEDWPLTQKMAAQQELLGVSLEAHPLELLADRISAAGAITTLEAAGRLGQRVTVAGIRQSGHRSRTAKGELMMFMTLEDLVGMLDVAVFPDIYQPARSFIHSAAPLLVTGIVRSDPDRTEPLLTAEKVSRLG